VTCLLKRGQPGVLRTMLGGLDGHQHLPELV
jgi:hypothetical protein